MSGLGATILKRTWTVLPNGKSIVIEAALHKDLMTSPGSIVMTMNYELVKLKNIY